tara:strand:+ start:1468 stop:1674 length:207 start_codon:yes stop_codon:yes gene_type:complete
MRTWTPKTPLQQVLFDTYTTKERACVELDITQPTLRKLFINEEQFTYDQLKRISTASKMSLIKIIRLL